MLKILIIYSGGTFGMRKDPETDSLIPFNIDDLFLVVPELTSLAVSIEVVNTKEVLDSSNMTPDNWLELNLIIQNHYNDFDGFVVLHGTDTMSFSASALSYLLKGLMKPVILTGAQLPIGFTRNDARDNLIGSIDVIIESVKQGLPINEVCVYFDNKLLRGNRTTKIESEDFSAFESKNYPLLGKVGVDVNFSSHHLLRNNTELFSSALSSEVGVLTFFPGILNTDISRMFDFTIHQIVILRSYGSGNLPVNESFYNKVKSYISEGGIVLNTSQCIGGKVIQKQYEVGNRLEQLGVLGMSDITFEACVTKAMYALGNVSLVKRNAFLTSDFVGELSSI